MNLAQVIKNWRQPSEAIGMEITFFSRDSFAISLCGLKRIGESVEIEWEENELTSLDDLPADKFKNKRVVLSVCGKGVLNKTVTLESTDLDTLCKMAFPNIAAEDFIVQVAPDEGQTTLSILRVDQLEECIRWIEQAGAALVNVQLNVQFLSTYLGTIQPEQAGHQLLKWSSDGKIEKFETQRETSPDYIDYHGVQLRSKSIIPYFTALGLMIDLPRLAGSHMGRWIRQDQEWKSRLLIKQVAIGFVGVLLLLLTVNVLVFNHYHQKTSLLDAELSLLSGDISQLEELHRSISDKQELLEKINFSGQSQYALYADQIAATVPQRLELSKMEFAPVKEKINRGKKELEFGTAELVLQGQIKQSDELQSWTQELIKLPFISDLSIEQFTYDFDKRTNYFQLNLTLDVE